MSDIEGIVHRTVSSVRQIADRVARASTKLLLVTAVIVVGSFLLGMAALSDGIESVWATLGIVFGAIAIGAAVLARWRIGRVRRQVPALASDIRALVESGSSTAVTVIDVFDREADGGSPIGVSRNVISMRSMAGQSLAGTARLAEAVRAITTFPLLALLTIAITAVFAFLALIFLLALAL